MGPTKVYGGADVNLHISQSDFEVEVFFVTSCLLFSRKPCYRTSGSLNPSFLSRIEPHSSNSVFKESTIIMKLLIDVKYFNP